MRAPRRPDRERAEATGSALLGGPVGAVELEGAVELTAAVELEGAVELKAAGAVSAPAADRRPARSHRRSGVVPAGLGALLALAVAVALWAVLGSLAWFPHLSDNNDEAAYLLQADALRHGRLFPPAPAPAEAFLPWLSAISGDRFVSKYTPVHPGIIALARLVLGSDRAALALIAVAAVASGYWLALEVLGRRRPALLAAAILALSPSFLIQSTMFLSYLSTLALLQAFAAALLAGARRRSRAFLALAGLLLGLALFARPFDALLVSTPFLAWWVSTRRGELRRLVGEARFVALGAALPLLLMLAYFRASTGSPFRPPFTLLSASDTLGFGDRRMFELQPAVSYTPARALQGLFHHAVLTSFWSFGGLALVGLAAWSLRRPRRGPEVWLGLVALTVPVGYLFFWGTYGSAMWGGPWRFGPFYHLPVITPVAILGARGLIRLWSRDRAIAAATGVGMLALSAFVTVRAVAANLPFTQERSRLFAPLVASGIERGVVFLPDLQGPWLLQPFAMARNAAPYDGPVIWALDRGEMANLEVLDAFPGRAPYRLIHEGERGSAEPDLRFTATLEPLQVARGASLSLALTVANPTEASRILLEVESGAHIDRYLVDLPPATVARRQLLVGPGFVELTGRPSRHTRSLLAPTRSVPAPADPHLRLRLRPVVPGGTPGDVLAELDVPLRRRGAHLEALLPRSPTGITGADRAPLLAVSAGPDTPAAGPLPGLTPWTRFPPGEEIPR